MDWTDACGALERLDLAHLVERQNVAHVLDELAADPLLFLSVELSLETLSADPAGQPVAWAELLGRLRHDRDLASRLVIHIHSTVDLDAPIDMRSTARPLLCELRKLGVGIATGGWSSIDGFVAGLLRSLGQVIPFRSHQRDMMALW